MTEINTNIEILKKILKRVSEARKNEFSLFDNSGLDPITIRHSRNTMALMTNLSIDKDFETVCNIAIGALLHDIGKANKEIRPLIEKPGKLSNPEYQVVKRHTNIGYELLREHGIVDETILSFSYNHHIRNNGEGYPLKKKDFPLNELTILFSLVDSYEAITSQDRRYQHRFSPHNAIKNLKKDCKLGNYGPTGIINLGILEDSLKRIGVIKNPFICPILIEDYMEISIF